MLCINHSINFFGHVAALKCFFKGYSGNQLGDLDDFVIYFLSVIYYCGNFWWCFMEQHFEVTFGGQHFGLIFFGTFSRFLNTASFRSKVKTLILLSVLSLFT